MSCFKNKKKLLFITYSGRHEHEVIGVTFLRGYAHDVFETRKRCIHCGYEYSENKYWEELIRMNISNSKIRKARYGDGGTKFKDQFVNS